MDNSTQKSLPSIEVFTNKYHINQFSDTSSAYSFSSSKSETSSAGHSSESQECIEHCDTDVQRLPFLPDKVVSISEGLLQFDNELSSMYMERQGSGADVQELRPVMGNSRNGGGVNRRETSATKDDIHEIHTHSLALNIQRALSQTNDAQNIFDHLKYRSLIMPQIQDSLNNAVRDSQAFAIDNPHQQYLPLTYTSTMSGDTSMNNLNSTCDGSPQRYADLHADKGKGHLQPDIQSGDNQRYDESEKGGAACTFSNNVPRNASIVDKQYDGVTFNTWKVASSIFDTKQSNTGYDTSISSVDSMLVNSASSSNRRSSFHQINAYYMEAFKSAISRRDDMSDRSIQEYDTTLSPSVDYRLHRQGELGNEMVRQRKYAVSEETLLRNQMYPDPSFQVDASLSDSFVTPSEDDQEPVFEEDQEDDLWPGNPADGDHRRKGKSNDHSYIALISKAILSSPEKRLLLSDIYKHISENNSDLQCNQKAWRNSVRHNLSLNECFVKQVRLGKGRGHYWTIHPACVEDFTKGIFKRRQARRRSKNWSSVIASWESSSASTYMPVHDSEPIDVRSSLTNGIAGTGENDQSYPYMGTPMNASFGNTGIVGRLGIHGGSKINDLCNNNGLIMGDIPSQEQWRYQVGQTHTEDGVSISPKLW